VRNIRLAPILYRIGFQGEDDPTFFRIGSWLVVAGSIPLAIGIAADVAVVFYKLIENSGAALAAGLAALIVLIGLWLGSLQPAGYLLGRPI
jgi:hypothetical protein